MWLLEKPLRSTASAVEIYRASRGRSLMRVGISKFKEVPITTRMYGRHFTWRLPYSRGNQLSSAAQQDTANQPVAMRHCRRRKSGSGLVRRCRPRPPTVRCSADSGYIAALPRTGGSGQDLPPALQKTIGQTRSVGSAHRDFFAVLSYTPEIMYVVRSTGLS
jgi:hypothetical protein